jgi:hypothetical protein
MNLAKQVYTISLDTQNMKSLFSPHLVIRHFSTCTRFIHKQTWSLFISEPDIKQHNISQAMIAFPLNNLIQCDPKIKDLTA